MARRHLLNQLLKSIAANVYFDPPDGFQMQYPCITYQRDRIDTKFADDKPYSLRRGYQVTVIDRDGDSPIVEALSAFPLCSFSSHFVTENLHHDVFSLYF